MLVVNNARLFSVTFFAHILSLVLWFCLLICFSLPFFAWKIRWQVLFLSSMLQILVFEYMTCSINLHNDFFACSLSLLCWFDSFIPLASMLLHPCSCFLLLRYKYSIYIERLSAVFFSFNDSDVSFTHLHFRLIRLYELLVYGLWRFFCSYHKILLCFDRFFYGNENR